MASSPSTTPVVRTKHNYTATETEVSETSRLATCNQPDKNYFLGSRGEFGKIQLRFEFREKHQQMASKRKTVSDSGVSAGAAAAPARAKIGRKSQVTQTATSDSLTAQPVTAKADTAPSFKQIAQLAYSYWEARGYQNGSPEEDWLRAEAELRAQSFGASA